jgi:hypothetical protein
MKEPANLLTPQEEEHDFDTFSPINGQTAQSDWHRLAIDNARRATEAVASGQHQAATSFTLISRHASRMMLLLLRREPIHQATIRPREFRARASSAA